MNKSLGIALLCAAAASPVFAQSRGHWYGALDFGKLTMKDSNYPQPRTMSVTGGYRFSRNLGMEGSLMFVGDATLVDTTGTSNARQSGMQLAGLAFLPLGRTFELFGKGGLGFHTMKTTGTGAYAGNDNPYTTTNVIIGAGVQVNFTSKLSMRLQYESLGKAKSTQTDRGAAIGRMAIGAVLNF